MVPRASIEEISAVIAREFAPERIILFGSYAYGVPDADSDPNFAAACFHAQQCVENI